MNLTEKQIEKLIDRLALSTRSPRGNYSAASSRKLFDQRVTARRRRRFLHVASSVAAVFLLCALIGGSYFYLVPAPMMTVSTLAENKVVLLPDGTEVTLNRYTSFSYPKKFKTKNREVQLEGGAYFAVSKDKKHPFIVQAGSVSVEVLGTEFDVEAYPQDERVQTVLFEGSVAVGKKNQPALLLVPGERAVYEKTDGSIRKEEVGDMDELLAWKQGALVFNDFPLKEVARKLSNAFGVKVQVKGEALGKKRINARFIHGETVDEILQLLKEAAGFKITRPDKTTYILSEIN